MLTRGFCIVLLLTSGVATSRGAASSADYLILQDSLDSGGGRSQSTNYSFDASVSDMSGFSQTAGPSISFDSGYAGQLSEEDVQPPPPEPSISVVPDQITPEDTPKVVSFTVSDAETPALNLVVTATSSNPTLVLNSGIAPAGTGLARSVTIIPVANQSGSTLITVTVRDEGNNSASRTFTLTVSPVDDLPVAENQSVTTSENQDISFRLSGMDADNDVLTFRIITDPDQGALTGTPPDLTYTPDVNLNGNYSFTFVANDGTGDSDPATIDLTILAVNQSPTLDAIVDQSISEDSGELVVTLSGISAGPTDEVQTVSVSAFSSDENVVGPPVVEYTSPNATGSIRLSPATNASGEATITVTVSDDGGTDLGGVDNVTRSFEIVVTAVNDLPTISSVASQVTDEDVSIVVAFTVSDVESEVSDLTLNGESSNTVLVPHGNLVLGGSGVDRTVTLTPAADQSGVTTVTISVSDDQGGQADQMFELTVNPVNDPPVANPQNVVVDQGITKSITLDGSDVESDSLTFSVLTQPTGGTLNGTAPDLTYTPNAGTTGSDAFTFGVNDSAADSGPATVQITINAVSHVVSIGTISDQTTPEDAAVQVDFAVTLTGTSSENLSVAGSSSNQTRVPNANIVAVGSGLNRSIVITPASNQFGQTTITISVSDDLGNSASRSFVLIVTEVNDLPVATALALTTEEDHALTLRLEGTDVENEALVFTVVSQPSHGILSGTAPNLTYTSNSDVNGVDSFTFQVNDGKGDSAPAAVDLTINSVNDSPSLDDIEDQTVFEDSGELVIDLTGISAGPSEDTQTITVSVEVSDESVIGTSVLEYASADTTGTLRLIPVGEASGESTVTITVQDDGGTNLGGVDTFTRSFTLTVTAVNDLPSISAVPDQTIDEDSGSGALVFTVSDVETDAEQLTTTGQSSNSELIDTTRIVLGGSGGDRTVTLTPVANESGTAIITLIVRDEAGEASSENFVLTVNGVNDLPTISDIDAQSTNEDTARSVSFTIGDVETVSENLTLSGSSSDRSLVPNVNLSFGGTGANRTVTVAPEADISGTATITLTVDDGQGGQTSQSFDLLVNAVNDAPVANAQNVVTDANTAKSIILTGSDTEDSALTFTVLTQPTNGVLSGVAPDLTYTPNADATGADSFTFRVNDGTENSAASTVQITINTVSDGIIIDAITDQSTLEDTAAQVDFGVEILSGATGNVTIVASSSEPTLVPDANLILGGSDAARTLVLIPVTDQSGSALITLTASDEAGQTSSRTFELTVTPVNDPPEAEAQTVTGLEDQQISIQLTGSDIDNDSLAYRLVSDATNGTLNGTPPSLTYTPDSNATGNDSLTFVVNDGQVDSSTATVSLDIEPVNDPPTLDALSDRTVNEDNSELAIELSGIAAGPADEVQAITITADSNNGALVEVSEVEYASPNRAGTLLLTLVSNASGEATIIVTAQDDGGIEDGGHDTVSETFKVFVNSVNDLPTITAITDQTINEDTSTAHIAFTVGDAETPVDQLNPSAETSDPSLIDVAGTVFGGSGASRSVVLTPLANQFGTVTVAVSVRDDSGGETSRSFLVTVQSVNDLPSISPISSQSTLEDTAITIPFTIADLETAVSDLALSGTSSSTGIVPNSSLSFSGTGADRSVTVTPAANQTGTTSLTLTVADGQGGESQVSFDLNVTEVDDPPEAISQHVVTDQGVAKAITLTGSDLENDPLVFAVISQPAKGTLSGSAPNLTYTPGATETGVDTFTFQVNDGTVDSGAATVQITINAVSDLINIGTIADQTLDEDSVKQFDVTLDITGVIVGSLSATGSSSNPALISESGVTLVPTETGFSASIAPASNQHGETTVTVNVSDEGWNSSSRSFVLTVTPVNDLPVATPQSILILEDQASSMQLLGSDVENDSLSYRVVSSSSGGLLSGTAPNLIYTPSANFNGNDSFTFVVSDGGGDSEAATVSLTVEPVNDPPTLNTVSDYTISEDSGELSINLSGISAGPSSETQTISLNVSLADESVISIAGVDYTSPNSTGVLRLSPVANANGEATISVTVTDDGGSTSGGIDTVTRNFEVSVTGVNDPPTITVIEDQTVNEDGSSSEIGFTVADIETEPVLLTVIGESSNSTLIEPLGIEFSGAGSNRTVKLTPQSNQTGTAHLTISVRDEEGVWVSETFVLTVDAANDLPEIGAISGQVIDEDTATGTILVTVQDQETAVELLTLTGSSSNQALLTDSSIVLGGTGENRTIQITPVANAFGSATVTISAGDTDGGTTELSFSVTVVGVNDAPEMTAIADQTLEEDAGVQTIDLTLISPGPANESAETVTITATSSNPSLIADPVVEYTSPSDTGTLTYSPLANETGTATLNLFLQDDGSAENGGVDFLSVSFNVTVGAVNDPPVLATISNQTVNEGNLLTVGTSATDVENGTLTFSLDPGAPTGASIDPATGIVSWTPEEAEGPGSVDITVRVTDDGSPALSVTQSFTATVNELNISPSIGSIAGTIVDEGSSVGFSVNATDSDIPANGLSFTLNPGAPSGATISSGGFFSWSPGENDGPGSYSISVQVTDGGTPALSASQSFSVTVNELNQTPVLSPIGSVIVDEGSPISVQAAASDPDFPAQSLSYSLDPGAPVGSSVNSSTGEISWTPSEGQGPGTYTLRVVVSDNGSPVLSSSQTFSVSVNEVNVAPFLATIADQTVAEGSTMNAFVAGADLDLPSQGLTFSLGSGAPSGVTIDPTSGVVTWTPDESQGGATHTITVVLTDDGTGNLSSSQTFEVNTLEVNTTPVIGDIGERSIRAGNELSVSVSASDPDIPADTLTISSPFGPAGSTIDPTTGLFTWTPDPSTPAGPVRVTVQVNDSGSPSLSATASFTITVTAGNSSPNLLAIAGQATNEGDSLTVNVSATDSDDPAQGLAYSIDPGAPAGVGIDSQSGVLTWTPTEEEGPGSYPITVRVTDDGTPVLSVAESFTVVVGEVNEPPVLNPSADQTVLEGDLLSISVTATDPDLPANNLTYSLGAGAPQGASIDPISGLFTWTPALGQGASTISVQVDDNGTPNLSAVQTFNITVEALNRAPQLAAIADQSVDEGTSFNLAVTATDEDLPAQTLTYGLGTAPSGMEIDAATGLIAWTPTEEQGPSENPVTVEVTDSGVPSASGTQSFTVVVNEVNQLPVLAAISDQAVVFGNTLSISAQATDADLPANTLSYSLGTGAPTRATIDTTTGLLEWTPTADQADASHGFTIIVQDDGTPTPGEGSQSFTVAVASSNTAPELAVIADQTVDEGEQLALTITGTDTDVPAQPLRYQLVSGPPGAQIDALTGEFTWPPTEEEGPAIGQITVQVSDSVTPPLSASSTFTVTVNEVNAPPAVESVSSEAVTVNEEEAVSVTVTGSDPDLPANVLTYSLGANAPEGSSVDPTSGVFSWTPSKAQGPSENTIIVVVSDDGTPSLSANATFTVVVNEINSPPTLAVIGDQTVIEGDVLTFSVAGGDTDLPAQELSYSLALGAPAGASIEPATGVFNWTPTETQGPFTGTISVRVTDSGTPIGRASQDVNVTVEEANIAPVLGALSDQIVSVGDILTVEANATDADLPPNALTFSLTADAPAGAAINATTGVFTWTPTLNQVSPATTVTVVATDNGPETLSQAQSFNVEVKEGVNLPPSLSTITDQTVPENGSTPSIAFTLTDADTPLENSTFTVSSSNLDLVPEGNVVIAGAGENRTVQVTPAANLSGSATITLAVREPAGGQASTSFALTVAPLPPVFVRNLASQVEVLVGGTVDLSVTVSGSQPIAYLWTKDGVELPGETAAVLALSDVTVEATGSYSVSAENSVGSVNSDSTQVNVIVPLRIVDQPVGQKVLVGADVSFGVRAVGEAPLTYRWFAEGVEIPGATGETLGLGSVEAILAGSYTVVVSNAGGSVSSTAAVLEVIAPIQVTVQPQSQTSVAGESASLSVAATGSEPIAYQWQFNGIDIGGETQATLSLANLTPNNTGDYAVVVSNEGGSVISSAATLAVNTPPVITQQPQGKELLEGTPVSFEVTVSGTEPLTYQWQFHGAPIDGATGRSLSITDVTVDTAGDYAVTVTNGAGSVSSEAATLAVVQPVVITTQPQNQTVTAGAGVSFNVTVTGTDPSAYQWQFGGVNIDGATGATLSLSSVQAADAGTYQVVVSNVAGPISSVSATLTVNVGVRILEQPQSVTVTSGGRATFSVLASGTPAPTYQWRLDGNDIAGATGPSLSVDTVSPANAGAYSVVVQNVVGSVTSGDAVLGVIVPPSITSAPQSQTVDLADSVAFSVSASGDAPLSYQWQKNGGNIAGATGESFTIASVLASDSGSYGVVVENPGGAATSASASLSVNLPPIDSGNSAATAPPPIEDSSGSFDGGSNASGGGQIARRNAPPATGGERWYSWRAPSSGIATFDTAGSTFDTVLSVYTGTADALTLIATDDDRGGFLTSRVRFNASVGTTYLVSVKGFGNAAGQIVVSFDLISTSQKLPVLRTSPKSVTAPVGSDATFAAVAVGTDLTYQWFRDGTEIAGATEPTLQLTGVQETDALSYSLKVTSVTVSANPVSVESLPALLHVGTVNTLSADKFLDAPRLTGGAAVQNVGERGPIEPRSLRAVGAVAEGFSGSMAFSTFGATKEQGEPNHCEVVGGASRWITYVAPEDGVVRISTAGSDFDTVLGVYFGTNLSDLVLEGCDNNGNADGTTSSVDVRVTAGNEYFIAVDGVGGATGLANLGCEFGQGPEIAAQPQGVSVSVDEQAVLFVQTAEPAPGATAIEPAYQWTKDGFPIPGEVNNNLAFPRVTLADIGEYAVVVSNFAGSTTSDTVRLDVSVPLTITTQPSNQSVNVGDPVSLSVVASGSTPIRHQWQHNGTDVPGATAATYPIASAQPSDEGSYTVVVSNAVGTVTSDPATLSLSEAPVVNVPPVDVAVVVGQHATLTVNASGTGTLTYQWRFNGVDILGATQPGFALFNVGPENVGDYTVVVSNEAGSVISAPARITVQVPFAIVEQPRSQAVAVGSTALFTVRVSGSGPFTYQWRVNGTDLAGAIETTLVLPNLQAVNAGSYTVVVSSDAEQIVSQGALLSVSSLPVISGQPQGGVFFAGQGVIFSVSAAGSGVLQYQWLLDGEPVIGATEAGLTLRNIGVQAAGSYSVIVSNNAGSVGSELAILTVREIVSQVTRSTGINAPSSEFSFRVSVPNGNQARVQYTLDFRNWTDLTPVPVTGTLDISDPDSVIGRHRFYRVVLE